MLVVTFIANYLATTLPNKMQVNELNHEVQVENQLGHFRALLQSVSGTGTPGAPALQPITLGSAGVPPFGPPAGGSVSSLPGEPPAKASFGMVSTRYAPPTGWRQNGSAPACSLSPPPPNTTSITCTGYAKSNIWYNFAGSTNYTFSIKGNGQVSFVLNFSTNRSSISVSAAGGAYNLVQIVGSYDTATVSGTGGANLNVNVVGSHNNVSIGDTGGGTVNVLIVGNHDTVAINNLGQSHTFVVGWGSYDLVSPTTGGGPYTVFFNGFDAENPSSPICPYGTAALTDNVTGVRGVRGEVGVPRRRIRGRVDERERAARVQDPAVRRQGQAHDGDEVKGDRRGPGTALGADLLEERRHPDRGGAVRETDRWSLDEDRIAAGLHVDHRPLIERDLRRRRIGVA